MPAGVRFWGSTLGNTREWIEWTLAKTVSPSAARTELNKPTIRDGCREWRCTKKFSANFHWGTEFSSRPHRGNYRLLTENSALSSESAVQAILKSGWTLVAKFDSISTSIRISTTDTPSPATAARGRPRPEF